MSFSSQTFISVQKILETNTIDDLALAGDYPEKPGNQYNVITCDDPDKNTQA